MRYVMKQKVFSWSDNYIIRDEMGKELYQVKGKLFSFGDQLSFQDMAGSEFAQISQKLLSWGPTYEIYHSSQLMAVVKKELFSFFNCRFSIDVEGPDDITASGNFLDYEYTFTRSGREIARVTKEWLAWGDTYGIDIADGENQGLFLAAVVVIDLCCHDGDRGSSLFD